MVVSTYGREYSSADGSPVLPRGALRAFDLLTTLRSPGAFDVAGPWSLFRARSFEAPRTSEHVPLDYGRRAPRSLRFEPKTSQRRGIASVSPRSFLTILVSPAIRSPGCISRLAVARLVRIPLPLIVVAA